MGCTSGNVLGNAFEELTFNLLIKFYLFHVIVFFLDIMFFILCIGLLFDMTGNYNVTFYCTGLCIIVSGAMVIPVAKSVRCWQSTPTNSKDPLPLDSRSNKVKFQEQKERDMTINFPPAEDEVIIVKDKLSIYNLKEKAENSCPLLSGENKSDDDVDKTENGKFVMYENPLSLP